MHNFALCCSEKLLSCNMSHISLLLMFSFCLFLFLLSQSNMSFKFSNSHLSAQIHGGSQYSYFPFQKVSPHILFFGGFSFSKFRCLSVVPTGCILTIQELEIYLVLVLACTLHLCLWLRLYQKIILSIFVFFFSLSSYELDGYDRNFITC